MTLFDWLALALFILCWLGYVLSIVRNVHILLIRLGLVLRLWQPVLLLHTPRVTEQSPEKKF